MGALRGGWLTAWLLIVIVIVTACAGDSGDKAPSNSSDVSAAASPATTASDPAAAQTSPQPDQPTSQPLAAQVNGQPITMADFERERDRQAAVLFSQPATQAAFDAQVLQMMIDQELINQGAAREGIVVSDAEIDAELSVHQQIAAQNGQNLDQWAAAQNYTMDEYRALIQDLLLTQKLSQVVGNVSPFAPQVHARHILVADENTARSLLQQIQQGADFAQLAMQYSLDSSTAPTGGDLDWVSEGLLLQPEVEAAIFSLLPGQVGSEPVHSSLGYHVIQVLERVEDRPLAEAALAEKKRAAFESWLESQRQSAVIERYVGLQ